MKRFLILATILLIRSIPGLTQIPNNSIGTNDPDAKKILDAVTAKFKTYKTVKAEFTMNIEGSNGKLQASKKGLVNMKDTKYRVSLTGQEIFCDGVTVWTFDKSSNEVQISQYDPGTSAITPQKLFSNFYDKDFLYKQNADKKQGGKTIQEIELTPVDKSKAFFKVLVFIDKATRNIVGTKVFEKNGNRYSYMVSKFSPNAKIDDSMFSFDAKKFPGVEVIDLR
jgi:outer membrane lipoprotein carrier protein